MMRVTRCVATALTLTALCSGAALAGPSVSRSLDVSASFLVSAEPADGCSNSPGPYINLAGEISLGGLQARLRFSNNRKGTHVHEEDVLATVSLLSDEPIRFAKQPSRGGVGGNPHVFLLLSDPSGAPLADAIHLGRCVQGFGEASLDVVLPALAEAEVASGGCSGMGGPNITVEGALVLGGLDATLVFTNNSKFTHVHEEDVTVGLTLLPEGETIVFPKQPPLGGAGGNPLVYLQLLDGDGDPIGDEVFIGRCNSL